MISPLQTLFFFFLFSDSYSYHSDGQEELCYEADDFEYQCLTETDNIVIHTKDEEILIDCPLDLNSLKIQNLPRIKANRTERFILKRCPWPNTPFKKILAQFSLSQVFLLEVSESLKSEIKADFKGLRGLGHLTLSDNKIKNLGRDVFLHTPNLLGLELNNNNIRLEEDTFKNLPFLQFLDLSLNNLEDLPPNIFRPLKNLERLDLWGNKLTKLDDFVFDQLVNLESLELSTNRIEEISEDAFTQLKNLRQVNLSQNRLQKLPLNLFRHNKNLSEVRMTSNYHLKPPDYLFANTFLNKIDLASCHLKTIPEGIFTNSVSLKILNLKSNGLKYLPEVLFQGLVSLEEINLDDNQMESVSKAFSGLHQLKSLFLQNNLITMFADEAFTDLENLETLNLQNNRITNIDAQLFSNMRNLQVLDISYNSITTPFDKIIDLHDTPSLTQLNLSHNKVTSVKLEKFKPKTSVVVELNDNPVITVDFQNFDLLNSVPVQIWLENSSIGCDCHNYNLFKFLKNRKKHNFDIKIDRCVNLWKQENISLSMLTCALTEVSNYAQCPENCSCNWRPFDKSVVIDCSFKNLTEFPNFDLSQVTVEFKHIIVNLQGNYLTSGPNNSTGYDNVTHLLLSDNKIRSVSWLPPHLEMLKLDHNHLAYLDKNTVKQLSNKRLVKLALHDNPWLCNCDSLILSKFLLQYKNIFDRTDIRCVNTSKLLINLEGDVCPKWELYFTLIMLVVLLFLATMFALYYRYQQPIKIWFFAKNLCLCWVSEEDLDKDKTYDAFISYSQKDEDFVTKELIPRLEQGPRPFRLCLHQRDWIPGELITSQISTSVHQSRRTLVVLSKNFLESVWGKLEFRTAHTKAMMEGRTRVIVILYGDVDENSLNGELQMYVQSNTYVKWGEQFFWNKLIYALPHRRVVSGSNKGYKRRNPVWNDESKLIGTPPSSPGCTPPVSSRPSLAKINPFCFRMGGEQSPV